MKSLALGFVLDDHAKRDCRRCSHVAELGCQTCHGDSDMPQLNVMPTMAKLLKQELYSPENPKGFGCLECHTQEGT